MKIQPVVYAQVLGVSILSAGFINIIDVYPATAQSCNPFGCSQSGAGQCNPFGCPNPGAGPCTPFGCPASPQNNSNSNNNSPSNSNNNSPGNSSSRRSSRPFQVTNSTGQTINYLYASNSSQENWSDDLLGNNVLPAGQAWNLTLRGGCMFDFSATLADGETVFWEGINTCERDRIRLYD